MEAIRWEREGLPGGVGGRSHSVPSVMGLQYGVQGTPPIAKPSHAGELCEVKEMLMLQQEQLNRLSDTLAQLQTSQQPHHPPYRGPVICRQCQQPGHFARECEAGRVPPRSGSLAHAAPEPGMHHNSVQLPEN